MILGHSELRKLMKKHPLVTGLADRELKNPEGCVIYLSSSFLSFLRLRFRAFLLVYFSGKRIFNLRMF